MSFLLERHAAPTFPTMPYNIQGAHICDVESHIATPVNERHALENQFERAIVVQRLIILLVHVPRSRVHTGGTSILDYCKIMKAYVGAAVPPLKQSDMRCNCVEKVTMHVLRTNR